MTYHELPTTRPQRDDSGHFLLGLLAGAAVGGGVALLLAPRHGSEIRHGIASSAQQAGRRISQAVAGTARRNARRVVGDAGAPSGEPGGAGLSSTAGATGGASHLSGTGAPVPGQDSPSGAADTPTTPSSKDEPFDRGEDPNRVLSDVIGEATYEPAAVEPSETGPGATSPAPPADNKDNKSTPA